MIWLEECRMLYNSFLLQRKTGWEESKKSYTLYDQLNGLVTKKKEFPKLRQVHSQVLQEVGVRVDFAFRAFFRRVKAHEAPGYPRFKSYGRYDSFCYPTCSAIKFESDYVVLPKIGKVSAIFHREIVGNPKTLLVKRCGDKWFIFIVTDTVKKTNEATTGKSVGIDVGIKNFATFSDGKTIDNPRFFETDQQQLSRRQRKLAKAKSSEHRRIKKSIRRIHERIVNRRHNFANKTAKDLVRCYDVIAVEDIYTNSFLKKRWCNKQILDAAWASFIATLVFKAECAGKQVIKVNPAYTSQTCRKCGSRTILKLSDRIFSCECGHIENRDLNASHNILRLGLQSLAQA